MPDFYWRVVSPMIHGKTGRMIIMAFFTALFIFAPAYLPDGPLTFNVP